MVKLEHLLLGLLSWRRLTGYEISAYLEGEGRFLRERADRTQVYRTLGRMHEDGWISFTVQRNEGRPDAKIYTITASGEEELENWLATTYSPPPRYSDPEFKVRLLLLGERRPEQVGALLEVEEAARREQRAEDRARVPFVNTEGPAGEMAGNVDRVRQLYAALAEQGDRAFDEWISWVAEARQKWSALPAARSITGDGEQ